MGCFAEQLYEDKQKLCNEFEIRLQKVIAQWRIRGRGGGGGGLGAIVSRTRFGLLGLWSEMIFSVVRMCTMTAY